MWYNSYRSNPASAGAWSGLLSKEGQTFRGPTFVTGGQGTPSKTKSPDLTQAFSKRPNLGKIALKTIFRPTGGGHSPRGPSLAPPLNPAFAR